MESNRIWSKDHENILKEWKAKAFVNMWLQTNSSYYYLKINDNLTYILILMSTVSSAISFITNNDILRLIIAIFSIVVVILIGLLIEVRPGQKSEQYISTAKKYTSLIRNIDYYLSIPDYMREDPLLLIEKINKDIHFIGENESLIPKNIIKKFENKFGSIDKILYGDEIIDLITAEFKQWKHASKLLKNESTTNSILSQIM